MLPSRYYALSAESINVLMPLLNDKLPMFFGKPLRFRQLLDLQSVRLAKLDDFPNIKHCFAAAVSNVSVNWLVLVTRYCRWKICSRPPRKFSALELCSFRAAT